eukprot:738602-Lingulodinium_polyedra.AAC.1
MATARAAAAWRVARKKRGRWRWRSQIDRVAAPARFAVVAKLCRVHRPALASLSALGRSLAGAKKAL